MRHRHIGARVVLGSAISGAIGGLIAAEVMSPFSATLQKISHARRHAEGQKAQEGDGEGASPTLKTAKGISRGAFGHELSREERQLAGPAVHYAFGTMMGALYGGLVPLVPEVTLGRGVLFGATLWLTADEAALPLLGLSAAPTRYPASRHASALGSHIVYGLTTDLVRRIIRLAR